MAEKIRLTQHSGKGSADHNDRLNHQKALEKGAEIQDKHIDQERIKDNAHYIWDAEKNRFVGFKGAPDKPIREYEKAFYEKQYGESLRKTNENYIKQRHPERCKTVDDMLKQYDGKTFQGKPRPNPLAPEEIIIQVGSSKNDINPETAKHCLRDYSLELLKFCQEHNENIHILDMSLHMDEAVPHLHIRRVIDYMDEQGLCRVGQIKGLEQAEIPLPDPSKPRSRFNNRKMTIDKIMRDKFIEICKAHGLEIEEIPEQGKKHNRTKEEVIAESLERQAEQELQKEANNEQLLQNQEIVAQKQVEAFNELEELPQAVFRAADELLNLPEGRFLAIAEHAVNARTNSWGSHQLTSLQDDIVRDVQLYQNGYLTDKDIMPKDRKREQSRDNDLEL
jgi:DNA-binding transcriptional MerR regulator